MSFELWSDLTEVNIAEISAILSILAFVCFITCWVKAVTWLCHGSTPGRSPVRQQPCASCSHTCDFVTKQYTVVWAVMPCGWNHCGMLVSMHHRL